MSHPWSLRRQGLQAGTILGLRNGWRDVPGPTWIGPQSQIQVSPPTAKPNLKKPLGWKRFEKPLVLTSGDWGFLPQHPFLELHHLQHRGCAGSGICLGGWVQRERGDKLQDSGYLSWHRTLQFTTEEPTFANALVGLSNQSFGVEKLCRPVAVSYNDNFKPALRGT